MKGLAPAPPSYLQAAELKKVMEDSMKYHEHYLDILQFACNALALFTTRHSHKMLDNVSAYACYLNTQLNNLS